MKSTSSLPCRGGERYLQTNFVRTSGLEMTFLAAHVADHLLWWLWAIMNAMTTLMTIQTTCIFRSPVRVARRKLINVRHGPIDEISCEIIIFRVFFVRNFGHKSLIKWTIIEMRKLAE